MRTFLIFLLSGLLAFGQSFTLRDAVQPWNPPVAAGGGGGTLVAQYKLNGDYTDAIGGNNGTATGTPGNVTGQDGQSNHAMSFNGSQSILARASGSTTYPFSVTMWIKTTTAGTGSVGGLVNTNAYGIAGALGRSDGAISASIYSGSFYNCISTSYITNNTWRFIACVFQSATVQKLYVDGTSEGTYSVTSSLPTINGFCIADNGQGWGTWTGSIDDVRLYNVALTAGEITTLYEAGAE